MISAKVSRLPVTGRVIAYAKQCQGQSVRVATAAATVPDTTQLPYSINEKTEEQIIQLPSPIELKMLGIESYYAETRGSELVGCAATKKLLLEEKLRRTLQPLAPIQSIIKEHWRTKVSTLRPICPLTQEEL